MILHFSSEDVLKLALTAGLVPADMQTASAEFLQLNEELYVKTSKSLSRNQSKELKDLGVARLRSMPKVEGQNGQPQSVSCWAQILELQPNPQSLQLCDQSTVLFRIEEENGLANLIVEMLRLGNDRQSFLHYGANRKQLALLRVNEPPYYSLLRALDPSLHSQNGQSNGSPDSDSSTKVRAYHEQSPRVWVQLGYEHPRPESLQPKPGSMLLISAPAHLGVRDGRGVSRCVPGLGS